MIPTIASSCQRATLLRYEYIAIAQENTMDCTRRSFAWLGGARNLANDSMQDLLSSGVGTGDSDPSLMMTDSWVAPMPTRPWPASFVERGRLPEQMH